MLNAGLDDRFNTTGWLWTVETRSFNGGEHRGRSSTCAQNWQVLMFWIVRAAGVYVVCKKLKKRQIWLTVGRPVMLKMLHNVRQLSKLTSIETAKHSTAERDGQEEI